MGPSGAHHQPSATRRTAKDLRIRRREESPFHTRTWIRVEASDTTAQVLAQGQQGRQGQVCQITAISGKGTPRAD